MPLSGYYTAEHDVDRDEVVNFSNASMQDNHRKMLRRAANRRSAQLSRARKKAHLEELKVENARLQRLVDIMDSQPELVFCINKHGDITYVSERTETFININLSGDGSDEVPTHISQILSKESVDSVLGAIDLLSQHSDSESTLFSSKKVVFHDAFGHPLVGYLRCSKVNRNTTLQELQSSEDVVVDSSDCMQNLQNHSAKKARTTRDIKPTIPVNNSIIAPSSSGIAINDDDLYASKSGDWSTLKLLTDCVSSLLPNSASNPDLTELEKKVDKITYTDNFRTNNDKVVRNQNPIKMEPSTATDTTTIFTRNISNVSTNEIRSKDTEYVCVIRTSDNCFVPHGIPNGELSLKSESQLLLFSSQLSTASVVAHDLEQNLNSKKSSNKRSRQEVDETIISGDSEENTSETNNSSGVQPASESSKQRNSTSSETCSDDNSSNNIESSETNST